MGPCRQASVSLSNRCLSWETTHQAHPPTIRCSTYCATTVVTAITTDCCCLPSPFTCPVSQWQVPAVSVTRCSKVKQLRISSTNTWEMGTIVVCRQQPSPLTSTLVTLNEYYFFLIIYCTVSLGLSTLAECMSLCCRCS